MRLVLGRENTKVLFACHFLNKMKAQYARCWLMKKDSIWIWENTSFFHNMRTPIGCEGPNGNPSCIQPSVWKIPCASDRRRIYMCVDELGLALQQHPKALTFNVGGRGAQRSRYIAAGASTRLMPLNCTLNVWRLRLSANVVSSTGLNLPNTTPPACFCLHSLFPSL